MTDNQLFIILFEILNAGLASRGVANVDVAQAFQPTQQGAPSGRSVNLFKLFDTPIGHVRRDTVYDVNNTAMIASELQTYGVTYQVNALAIQDPSDLESLTASDIIKVVRQILQSSETIARLRQDGIAILRVNELRNPSFVDDKGRNEYSPSFDFTLTYDELYTAEAPIVETVEYNINRV